MQQTLYRLSIVSLIFVLMVMLAGSIVRMTGSGMGCPDWPKCFGYVIPPTDIETLTWRSDREFEKGNIIIRAEALYVAMSDFKAGQQFDPTRWEPYTKHDYASFNATHTWIEFINRLIGALTGIPVLILFVLSVFYFKRDPLVPVSALVGLLLLGFEAWLGKLVVDGNLIPHSITIHLFGAVGLVIVYVFLISRLRPMGLAFLPKRNPRIYWLGLICMFLLLFQIWLGASVREEIDALGHAEVSRNQWIEGLSFFFEFHRTFSIAILVLVGWFAISMMRTNAIARWPRILLFLIASEIAFGIGMAYFGVPAALQPAHLMFAIFSLAVVWYLILEYRKHTSGEIPL